MNYCSTIRKMTFAMLTGFMLASCEKEKEPEPIATEDGKEFKYMRVLVTDEVATKLTQLAPVDGTVRTFDTPHPLGTLYTTASGRYAGVMYGSNNLVRFFDTGLEFHGDHVDVKGTPKWAAITSTGTRPSHFKSKGNETLIFNDGDGTLNIANESSFQTAGATFGVINAGLQPHHGAMVLFNNGNIAVTESLGRVRVINKTGTTLHPSTIEVARIHGNATDGEHAVFGSFTTPEQTEGGVLVVKQNGEQRVIPNPAGFGAVRLGTILYAQGAKKFIGFGGTKGAYMINLSNNTISPIYEGTDVYQCKTDYAGNNLLLLTLDGKLRIYNLVTGALKKEGAFTTAVAATDAFKPVLEATSRFAYLAVPAAGEVHQINLSDFSDVVKHKVSAKPVRLTLLGFEVNDTH